MERSCLRAAEVVNHTIKTSNHCIFSYLGTDGFPAGKALNMPRKMEPQGVYWFSTVNHARKVCGARNYPKASVYFYDPEQFVGVSLSGTVEVIDDLSVKREFWREGDELFYPNGIDSDDYVILKFIAQTGRLYAQIQHTDFKPDILE